MAGGVARAEHQNRPKYYTIASQAKMFYGSPNESELSRLSLGRLPFAMSGRVIKHELGDNGSTVFQVVIEDKRARALLDRSDLPHQFWAVLTAEVDESTGRRKWLGGDYSHAEVSERARRGVEQSSLW